jgi:hypothetical protein
VNNKEENSKDFRLDLRMRPLVRIHLFKKNRYQERRDLIFFMVSVCLLPIVSIFFNDQTNKNWPKINFF